MIYKQCVLTIANNTAALDEDIYLYRLDKNVELYFTIVNNKYKFDKSDLNNIINVTNASYFQMRLYKNAEVKYTFAIQPTDDGKAKLTITNDLIDEPIEVGDYDFQISLLDADKSSMVSMPIVSKQLHVCEPLVGNIGETGSAILGLSQLDTTGEIVDAFDENGNYIRKVHVNGEIISAELFNKWETALETNTKNIVQVKENQINLVEDDTSMEGISDTTHDTLNTNNKTIIGAINEVSTQYKDIAKKVENVGQPTQQQINTAIDQAIKDGKITGGGGLNSTAKTLLETILRNAIYTTDQSANITALISALSSSGDTPSITKYTITNKLTKCTNGNTNTSVAENTSYKATITADAGYKLDTVAVTMGGKDVTSTVYSNGKITINSVTGNIVITATAIEKSSIAELPQNGLDIFFDFRNATITSPYNLSGWGNVAKVEPNGNNDYFVFSSTGTYTTDNHGIANFGTRGLRKKSTETTNYIGNGNSHTIIGMTYGVCIPSLYKATTATNLPNSIQFAPYYKNTNGESNKLSAQGITAPSPKVNAEYVIFALSMSDTELKLYSDGQLIATANSSDCTDFASWDIIEGGFGCSFSGTNNYMTACAYYNRPLSDVEIVEATEYLKTLEVHN